MAGPEDNWQKPWEPMEVKINTVDWKPQPRAGRPSRMSDSVPGSANLGAQQGKSNALDYMTIGLLAANLSAQWETRRVLERQALERELAFWTDVARERTGITDPIELRERAWGLLDFDAKETEMREAYLSDHASIGIPPFLPGEKIHKANAVAMAIFYTLLWIVGGFVIGVVLGFAMILPYAFTDGRVDIDGNVVILVSTIVGGLWGVGRSIKGMIYPAFSGKPFTSAHFDPRTSELAHRFPPGSHVYDVNGRVYQVVGWPVYQRETLKFRLPVDTATNMTETFSSEAANQFSHSKFWYGPWLSSDYLDWDYSSEMNMTNKEDTDSKYEAWVRAASP